MNERTHFFIKVCISHTLFSRGLMFLLCERDECRQRQTAILTQLLLLAKAALHPHLGWVAQTVVAESHSLKSASWSSLWPSCHQLTAAGTCLFSFIRPSCFYFFFRVFTLVYLLSDGSVKGQYITVGNGIGDPGSAKRDWFCFISR